MIARGCCEGAGENVILKEDPEQEELWNTYLCADCGASQRLPTSSAMYPLMLLRRHMMRMDCDMNDMARRCYETESSQNRCSCLCHQMRQCCFFSKLLFWLSGSETVGYVKYANAPERGGPDCLRAESASHTFPTKCQSETRSVLLRQPTAPSCSWPLSLSAASQVEHVLQSFQLIRCGRVVNSQPSGLSEPREL